MAVTTLRRIKRYDAARPGFAGEHWLVMLAGLGVWLSTRGHRSTAVRAVGALAGTALLGRAASGREGLAKVVRRFR